MVLEAVLINMSSWWNCYLREWGVSSNLTHVNEFTDHFPFFEKKKCCRCVYNGKASIIKNQCLPVGQVDRRGRVRQQWRRCFDPLAATSLRFHFCPGTNKNKSSIWSFSGESIMLQLTIKICIID
jgi:hypothetical protein